MLFKYIILLEQLFVSIIYDKVFVKTTELSQEYKRRVIEGYDEIEEQIKNSIQNPLNPYCWIGMTLNEIADYFDFEDNIREEDFQQLTNSLKKINTFLNNSIII